MGVLQGLTEFLPISSSGHLVLAEKYLGSGKTDIFFDTVLHLGTLIAVVIVLRKELMDIIGAFISCTFKTKSFTDFQNHWSNNSSFRLALLILIGTIPAVVLGLLFKETFEKLFSSTLAVGISLSVTGVFLLLTYFAPEPSRNVLKLTWRHAIIIGLAQALAITPGISRSGATISAAMFLKIDRELAGKFSFLLAIPAILGALVLQAGHIQISILRENGYFLHLLAGLISSAVVGYVALKVLLKLVKKGKLFYFGYYCILIGSITVIFTIFIG